MFCVYVLVIHVPSFVRFRRNDRTRVYNMNDGITVPHGRSVLIIKNWEPDEVSLISHAIL